MDFCVGLHKNSLVRGIRFKIRATKMPFWKIIKVEIIDQQISVVIA